MKKIYKIAITALTTAMVSVSALAAPHDAPRNDRNHPAIQQIKPQPNAHWQGYKGSSQQQHRYPAQHVNQPAYRPNVGPQHLQKWQVQHKLPQMYQNSNYRVSSYQRHQLSKPGFNQQWYKVNGYYLLADKKTDTIVKVVRA